MRCLYPRTVCFDTDGKTIIWSPKKYTSEYASFQLPCSKCIECRLHYAREWAVRCVHEATMHEQNSFITLTYENAPKRLQYGDFQNFIKRLRKSYTISEETKIGFFVTGEYGDLNKRPHWHAIIFNWRPSDLEHQFTNGNNNKVYTSKTLDKLWSHGFTTIGDVTFESAGYCARYAAKKLVHGLDQDHDFHPISKKSLKNAIGKKWLEKNYKDVFNYGYIILQDGTQTTIPRYYEKWLQKHKPDEWETYVTETKRRKCENAQRKQDKQKAQDIEANNVRFKRGKISSQTSRATIRKQIIESKFKRLQQHLRGDI